MNIPIEIDEKCSECGKLLNEDNYHGWFRLNSNIFGFDIQEPICDECNQKDNGSNTEGAY